MLTVTLYTRPECSLCNQAEADLVALQDKFPHKLVLLDIEEDEALLRKYGLEIPVVEVGPYTVKAPFDRQKLAMTLGAARDRVTQLEAAGDEVYRKKSERGQNISRTDRFFMWFSNHYMWAFNFFVLLYVGLPFLAPVMQHAGMVFPARVTYAVYSKLCHQLPYRSWFLYGEQAFYPRETAGIEGLMTYEVATGRDPKDLWDAREFIGNEQVGYKVAFCQRDVAIYGAILLFGLIFSLFKTKIKPLPIWAWVLIAIVPMGLDGGIQLLSQFLPGNLIPYHESTPFLRTLTGFLFGFGTAWFGYPLIEETMVGTRQILAVKFAALGKDKP